METAVKKKHNKIITTTTSHKSGPTNSTKTILQENDYLNQPISNGENDETKTWKISSITEKEEVPEKKTFIMNGRNDEIHNEESHAEEPNIIQSIKEKKKWKISSITEKNDIPEENAFITNGTNGEIHNEESHVEEPNITQIINENQKWKISSITETKEIPEENNLTINGMNGQIHQEELHVEKPQIIQRIKENKKWEIESINTIGEKEDEEDLLRTLVPFGKVVDTRMKIDTPAYTNGTFMIKEISEVEVPEKLDNQEDKISLSNSVFKEDSWVEHHTIPIHSSSVQMRNQIQPIQASVFKIKPISKGELGSRSIVVGNSQINNSVESLRSEITIGNRQDEFTRYPKVKPMDHFNYQYEDATKTLKLRQLAISNRNPRHHIYNSLERSKQHAIFPNNNSQSSQWPMNNCMRQSINVDNDDEEIIGVPLIFDEKNNPIKNLKDTQSFNSITENVKFQIQNLHAQMEIEISVEMYHNTDPRRQMWKRKKVKVTRIVELDLSKVRDKQRLNDIIDRCSPQRRQIGWTDKKGTQSKMETKLTGNDAYNVFYNLMAITHEEENEADAQENLYLTRTPSGKLTSVNCEPQFLLFGGNETQNSTFLY